MEFDYSQAWAIEKMMGQFLVFTLGFIIGSILARGFSHGLER